MESLTWVRCSPDTQLGLAKAELRRLLTQDGFAVSEQPSSKSLSEFIKTLKPAPEGKKSAVLLNIEMEIAMIEQAASDGKRLNREESQACAEFLLGQLNCPKLEGVAVYGFLYRHTSDRDRLHYLVDELTRGATAKSIRTASLYV